ncbi:MAG TPA: response regulator [Sphingomonas sp.]|nr:response regulator [Sphingomonas sp.]
MLAASKRTLPLPKPSVIAIVDDDEAVREALFDLLLVEGLAAYTFDGAAAFLIDAGIREYACVVTDVRMPAIDGLELQRRLRASGSLMPVIFVTSCTDEAIRSSAFENGAIAWFAKPVDDAALLATLRTVTNRPADDRSWG